MKHDVCLAQWSQLPLTTLCCLGLRSGGEESKDEWLGAKHACMHRDILRACGFETKART